MKSKLETKFWKTNENSKQLGIVTLLIRYFKTMWPLYANDSEQKLGRSRVSVSFISCLAQVLRLNVASGVNIGGQESIQIVCFQVLVDLQMAQPTSRRSWCAIWVVVASESSGPNLGPGNQNLHERCHLSVISTSPGLFWISSSGTTCCSLHAVGLRRKQDLVTLIQAAWVQVPSPTHKMCLCCSAMDGLMKPAYLLIRLLSTHRQAKRRQCSQTLLSSLKFSFQLGCSGASMQPERCHLFEVLYQDVQLTWWNTHCYTVYFHFQRLEINLKIYWLPFSMSAIFKTPQPNCKMSVSMLLTGRQPIDLATQ